MVLTLRAVFRSASRQTEGLIGSIITLLGLALAVPDHITMSRPAETLRLPRPSRCYNAKSTHLLVDSTGLTLCGGGEWLHEKHGTRTCRDWRTLRIGTDADTGKIVAATLTGSEACNVSQVGTLLDQVAGPVASFTADGTYDWDNIYGELATRYPDAAVIVPPRSGAVPSSPADIKPTQRNRHIDLLTERGRRGWQAASGYNWRALVEADVSRFKRVIGDGLCSRTDRRRATDMAVAVGALNRMLDLGAQSPSGPHETRARKRVMRSTLSFCNTVAS